MAWRFIGSLSTADIAFRASGRTLERLLASAVDAAVAAMAGNPRRVRPREVLRETIRAESEEMLLFELLQRVIYHKDASGLLLRLTDAAASGTPGRTPAGWTLHAALAGEPLDPSRHARGADLKAVTFQGYSVRRTWRGWEARVVLDV